MKRMILLLLIIISMISCESNRNHTTSRHKLESELNQLIKHKGLLDEVLPIFVSTFDKDSIAYRFIVGKTNGEDMVIFMAIPYSKYVFKNFWESDIAMSTSRHSYMDIAGHMLDFEFIRKDTTENFDHLFNISLLDANACLQQRAVIDSLNEQFLLSFDDTESIREQWLFIVEDENTIYRYPVDVTSFQYNPSTNVYMGDAGIGDCYTLYLRPWLGTYKLVSSNYMVSGSYGQQRDSILLNHIYLIADSDLLQAPIIFRESQISSSIKNELNIPDYLIYKDSTSVFLKNNNIRKVLLKKIGSYDTIICKGG